jgi:hypothetical protein
MSRSLKLCLLVPGKSGTVQPSAQCVRDVKTELRSLRDRINCLLDTLTDASPVPSPAKSAPAAEETPEYTAPAAPKEFDPLQDSGVPAANFSDNGIHNQNIIVSINNQLFEFPTVSERSAATPEAPAAPPPSTGYPMPYSTPDAPQYPTQPQAPHLPPQPHSSAPQVPGGNSLSMYFDKTANLIYVFLLITQFLYSYWKIAAKSTQ